MSPATADRLLQSSRKQEDHEISTPRPGTLLKTADPRPWLQRVDGKQARVHGSRPGSAWWYPYQRIVPLDVDPDGYRYWPDGMLSASQPGAGTAVRV